MNAVRSGLTALFLLGLAATAVPAQTLQLPQEGPRLLLTPLPATAGTFSGSDKGLIALPPPEGHSDGSDATNSIADPAEPEIPHILVTAPQRDRAAPPVPALTEGLMPLLPVSRLPEETVAGASLSSPGVMRLTGERLVQDMSLYLPDGTPLPEKLLLTLQSSIHVLTESARLSVSVNGGTPVTLPLHYVGGFGTLELPAGELRHGDNRLTFDIRQPHRIWCGPEATFAVWTEFDLSRSGAQVPESAVTPDLRGFALALRAQSGTGRPLPVLTESGSDAAILRQVTDQIATAMGGSGRITLRSFYTPGPKSFASVALIPSDKSQVTFRNGASGTVVMQIEHKDNELPPLAAYLPPPPPATLGVQLLQPGQTTPLSALGHRDVIGNTRYFLQSLPFRVPDSWLLLANQRARLQLHYGFSAGLAKGALLLIKINDQTVRMLPLDENGGSLQRPLDIDFQARFLRGGVNMLSFEMMVPGDPPDQICTPRQGDMLVVLASSTLTIPPAPPMELGGLVRPLSALTSAGVLPPEGGASESLSLLAARIAAGIGLPPRPDPSVRLYVSEIGDTDPVPGGRYRVSQRRLQRTLFPINVPQTPQQKMAAATAPAPAAPPTALHIVPAYQLEPPPGGVDAPATALASGTGQESTAEGFRTWLLGPDGVVNRLRASISSSAYIGSNQTLDDWLDGRQGVALLLRPDPAQHNTLWLFLGPRAPVDMISQSLSDLRLSRLASGEAALLSADGGWSIWSPISPPSLLRMPELNEWRSVLGNYASWSPLLYTGITLLLALLSALPVAAYLLMTRTTRGGRR